MIFLNFISYFVLGKLRSEMSGVFLSGQKVSGGEHANVGRICIFSFFFAHNKQEQI